MIGQNMRLFWILVAIVTSVEANFPNQFDLLFQDVNITEIEEAIRADHPHVNRTVIEIIEMYDYPAQTHKVITSDNYVLELHRIPGNASNPNSKGKPVVLLMHGIICSSSVFVLAGPERGLGFILADAGYDVWMGNVRGSKYSRKHLYTTVIEPTYWDFSWHEIGIRDIPAMIDYILTETGEQKLFYIGHSQGNTVFFSMLSELPHYNKKIKAMFALAPVAYSSNMYSPIFRFIAKFTNSLHFITDLIGKYEFTPTSGFFKKFTSIVCKYSPLHLICKNVLFLVMGFNNKQMDKHLLPVIVDHLPAGASVKQFVHYGQLIKSGFFRQFDYGKDKLNEQEYGQRIPPQYKLWNIQIPISIHYSASDWISDPRDVEKLYTNLPNVIGKFLVPDNKFNHIDFLWGKDVKFLLYDKVIDIMEHYKD